MTKITVENIFNGSDRACKRFHVDHYVFRIVFQATIVTMQPHELMSF